MRPSVTIHSACGAGPTPMLALARRIRVVGSFACHADGWSKPHSLGHAPRMQSAIARAKKAALASKPGGSSQLKQVRLFRALRAP